ncbi:MAG: hypothetical protein AVDCRST_MAG43-1525, partial [uncultured Thermomicrobiales bacterium]
EPFRLHALCPPADARADGIPGRVPAGPGVADAGLRGKLPGDLADAPAVWNDRRLGLAGGRLSLQPERADLCTRGGLYLQPDVRAGRDGPEGDVRRVPGAADGPVPVSHGPGVQYRIRRARRPLRRDPGLGGHPARCCVDAVDRRLPDRLRAQRDVHPGGGPDPDRSVDLHAGALRHVVLVLWLPAPVPGLSDLDLRRRDPGCADDGGPARVHELLPGDDPAGQGSRRPARLDRMAEPVCRSPCPLGRLPAVDARGRSLPGRGRL